MCYKHICFDNKLLLFKFLFLLAILIKPVLLSDASVEILMPLPAVDNYFLKNTIAESLLPNDKFYTLVSDNPLGLGETLTVKALINMNESRGFNYFSQKKYYLTLLLKETMERVYYTLQTIKGNFLDSLFINVNRAFAAGDDDPVDGLNQLSIDVDDFIKEFEELLKLSKGVFKNANRFKARLDVINKKLHDPDNGDGFKKLLKLLPDGFIGKLNEKNSKSFCYALCYLNEWAGTKYSNIRQIYGENVGFSDYQEVWSKMEKIPGSFFNSRVLLLFSVAWMTDNNFRLTQGQFDTLLSIAAELGEVSYTPMFPDAELPSTVSVGQDDLNPEALWSFTGEEIEELNIEKLSHLEDGFYQLNGIDDMPFMQPVLNVEATGENTLRYTVYIPFTGTSLVFDNAEDFFDIVKLKSFFKMYRLKLNPAFERVRFCVSYSDVAPALEILELKDADIFTLSEEQVRANHRRLAVKIHPDRNPGNEEQMVKINHAKDVVIKFLTERRA